MFRMTQVPSKNIVMNRHYVYLISCRGYKTIYVKIGLTSSIQQRLSNIQTGCPHPITHAFVVLSEYREEVKGLEKLLHTLLKSERLRAEWYEGSLAFFEKLGTVLSRVNSGGFSYEELWDMPDFVGPEFEIMMHRHNFKFLQVAVPIRKGVDSFENAQHISPAQIAEVLLREPSTLK